MNTDTTLLLESKSFTNTQQIGEAIGKNLRGKEVIELIGDVGVGKTEFVRGLARGAGSSDQVASPTFTISRIYKAKDELRINHFDFYRLADAGIMKNEIAEIIGHAQETVVVEWSDVISSVLPDDRLQIKFTSPTENTRKLELIIGPAHKHLTKDLA